MRHAVVAAGVSLLVVAGIASAQAPGTPPGVALGAGRVSISAEALMWWFKGAAAPPLVSDGFLGQPGTTVLLGGTDVDTNPNPGLRLTAGFALTERWGLESSVLYVPPGSSSRSVSSSGQTGSKDLSIPFFDVVTHGENDTPLSAAGVHAGRATEDFRNSLLGAELNATMRLPTVGPLRLDTLGGFRYLRLRETYTFSTDSPNIPPRPPDVFRTTDEFDTTNNFYGAQLGVRARYDQGPWFASSAVKFALGAMIQSVDVDGFLETNNFNDFGPPQRFAGGYFALPTNIGSHTRSVFAVVPEVGLNIGYRITEWASVFVGYTFLYTNSVVRAPQQVNRSINPSQSPAITGNLPAPLEGPAEPSFRFNASDFWAQGLNVGLALRF